MLTCPVTLLKHTESSPCRAAASRQCIGSWPPRCRSSTTSVWTGMGRAGTHLENQHHQAHAQHAERARLRHSQQGGRAGGGGRGVPPPAAAAAAHPPRHAQPGEGDHGKVGQPLQGAQHAARTRGKAAPCMATRRAPSAASPCARCRGLRKPVQPSGRGERHRVEVVAVDGNPWVTVEICRESMYVTGTPTMP